MSSLILKDLSLERSTQDDYLLTNVAHLTLELSSDAQFINKAILTSHESRPGLWETDQILVL